MRISRFFLLAAALVAGVASSQTIPPSVRKLSEPQVTGMCTLVTHLLTAARRQDANSARQDDRDRMRQLFALSSYWASRPSQTDDFQDLLARFQAMPEQQQAQFLEYCKAAGQAAYDRLTGEDKELVDVLASADFEGWVRQGK